MKIIRSPRTAQRECAQWRREGKTIALVPTMGALHGGHFSLIRAARKKADRVVVSIFVNPTQFGPSEDFDKYPHTFAADVRECKKLGVDAIFAPSASAMYPDGFSTWVNEESLSRFLCGARRPGHFRGVCTVVVKLMTICGPNIAVFGQKDAQQALIIRRMVRDLNVPVEIVVCPIVREEDGLAMSSRNQHLSPDEREQATALYRGLRQVKAWRDQGLSVAQVRRKLMRFIQQAPDARIDYVSIVDEKTLMEVTRVDPGQALLVAVAVFFNKVRLIDNIRLEW